MILETDEQIGRHLQLIPPELFVECCNRLLAESAASVGFREAVSPNLHVREPDGGIDARCEGVSTPVGRIIPSPKVVYQFKGGGQRRSSRGIAERDIIAQERVVEALKAGSDFVYMAAWDRGDIAEEDIARIVREHGVDLADTQVVFFGQQSLVNLRGLKNLCSKSFAVIDVEIQNPRLIFVMERWSRRGRDIGAPELELELLRSEAAFVVVADRETRDTSLRHRDA